ncbi:hypothetical protein FA13DRAFT_599918 [Coprinellus micaceus]|uniref:Uncharacterized protein n=1 Tax=Coprinellus micaceus TaxID=71717 RepID=A0A4Y7T7E7_COPMI|nr:hypothetical protein FA13DRAFT_599918 [Coprinellus micaceus]
MERRYRKPGFAVDTHLPVIVAEPLSLPFSLDRHHLRVLIYQAHPLLYFSRKSRRATFLRFWSFTLIRMSASSSAGGSSFPPTRDPAQRLPIPRPAIRPKHNRTCRCSQCYLRPSLFPRGDRGQIELPRPTWLESSSTGPASLELPRSVPGSKSSDPSGKGKEREIVSPIPSWSHDVRRLEGQLGGPSHPPSPSWHQNEALAGRQGQRARNNIMRPSTSSSANRIPRFSRAPRSPVRETSIAGPSSRPPRPPGNEPMVVDSRATPHMSQHFPGGHEPVFLTPVMSPAPPTGPPPRTGSKRKLSDLYDPLDPTEHVLDFRNPPPPQGRGFTSRTITRFPQAACQNERRLRRPKLRLLAARNAGIPCPIISISRPQKCKSTGPVGHGDRRSEHVETSLCVGGRAVVYRRGTVPHISRLTFI